MQAEYIEGSDGWIIGWDGVIYSPIQTDAMGWAYITKADGKQTKRKVAMIMAEAFLGGTRAGATFDYKDGNPRNNRLDNLVWVPKKNHRLKFTPQQVVEIRRKFDNKEATIWELAEEYEVRYETIYKMVTRITYGWVDDNGVERIPVWAQRNH